MSKRESAPASTSTNQLVVYLDTSKSMAGYLPGQGAGETTFSRTLQELRNFITLVNPPLDVLVRRVDVKVGEPLNNTVLSTASLDKSLYDGVETDLAGAFDLFPKNVAPGSESNNLPARFHILITDGVQSTTQQRLDLSCTAGSDQLCVRKRIFDLLNQGWGGCVIGLRSEFDGVIYSEINRAGHKPVSVPYKSDENDPQSLRPFYLYVFSPDREALEPFVTTLIDRLKPLTGQHPESLRVLPLSFRYAEGASKGEATVPPVSSPSLKAQKKDTADIPEFTIGVEPATAQSGAVPFSLELTIPWSRALLSGSAQSDLVNAIQWELIPFYPDNPNPRSRYPEVKYLSAKANGEGRVTLQFTAQWPPNQVGDMCWRGFRLEGRLMPENQTPEWVRAWSTNNDTTREYGNRTLYLEGSLLGLWRNEVIKKQLVTEAVIVAGKR